MLIEFLLPAEGVPVLPPPPCKGGEGVRPLPPPTDPSPPTDGSGETQGSVLEEGGPPGYGV